MSGHAWWKTSLLGAAASAALSIPIVLLISSLIGRDLSWKPVALIALGVGIITFLVVSWFNPSLFHRRLARILILTGCVASSAGHFVFEYTAGAPSTIKFSVGDIHPTLPFAWVLMVLVLAIWERWDRQPPAEPVHPGPPPAGPPPAPPPPGYTSINQGHGSLSLKDVTGPVNINMGSVHLGAESGDPDPMGSQAASEAAALGSLSVTINLYVLDPTPGGGEQRSHRYWRLVVSGPGLQKRTLEPEDEDAMQFVMERAYKDQPASLITRTDRSLMFEHKPPGLASHTRLGRWSEGKVGIASTLAPAGRTEYTAEELALSVAQFLRMVANLRITGPLTLELEVESHQLELKRSAAVASVLIPRISESSPRAGMGTLDAAELGSRIPAAAAGLVASVLRQLHQARVDSEVLEASVRSTLGSINIVLSAETTPGMGLVIFQIRDTPFAVQIGSVEGERHSFRPYETATWTSSAGARTSTLLTVATGSPPSCSGRAGQDISHTGRQRNPIILPWPILQYDADQGARDAVDRRGNRGCLPGGKGRDRALGNRRSFLLDCTCQGPIIRPECFSCHH